MLTTSHNMQSNQIRSLQVPCWWMINNLRTSFHSTLPTRSTCWLLINPLWASVSWNRCPHNNWKWILSYSGGSGGGGRGARDACPPLSQNFFIFEEFLGPIGRIVDWRLPLGVNALWEILDLPLSCMVEAASQEARGKLSFPYRVSGSATVMYSCSPGYHGSTHVPRSCNMGRLVVYPITERTEGIGQSQTPRLRSIPNHDRENDFRNCGLITFRCKAETKTYW